MTKCSLCGENTTTWGRNIPCKPTTTPLFEDFLPDQPELSAIVRGFSPGDVVRNSHGHVAIVTYANHKWGDIRVRLRGKGSAEYCTTAMGWRVVKKASSEQAQRWLAEEALRAKEEFICRRDFRIDPVTNETIHLHEEDRYYFKKFETPLHEAVNKIFMEKIMDDMMNCNKMFIKESPGWGMTIKKLINIDKTSYIIAKGKDGGVYSN